MPPSLLLDEQTSGPSDVPHTAACEGCEECGRTSLAAVPSAPGAAGMVLVPRFARRLPAARHVRVSAEDFRRRTGEALSRLDDLVDAARALRHRVVIDLAAAA